MQWYALYLRGFIVIFIYMYFVKTQPSIYEINKSIGLMVNANVTEMSHYKI